MPKDPNGKSDPYIKINAGKGKRQQISGRDTHLSKTLSPDFYKFYEVPVVLPGDSLLSIQLWDFDMLAMNDDFIGETVVDVENRIFSPQWVALNPKPREFRTLWSPSSTSPQGKIELWIDILTLEDSIRIRPTPLAPPAPLRGQVRCIVWNTKDVVFKDKESSDIFVRAEAEWSGKQKETDVHWRSLNGKGQFNWRMVFDVEIPCKTPRLKMQIWDKDMVGANDAIAEASLNLKGLLLKTYRAKTTTELDHQWIAMVHPNFSGVQGRVEVTLQIMPDSDAKVKPAGDGRDAPNQFPELDPPKRPNTSFAPWRIDKKISGFLGRYKWRIAALGCIGILFVIAYYYLMVKR